MGGAGDVDRVKMGHLRQWAAPDIRRLYGALGWGRGGEEAVVHGAIIPHREPTAPHHTP